MSTTSPGLRSSLKLSVAAATFGPAPGRLVSQRQLLQEVWGPKYQEETNYLRLFIAQIRRKLEPDPAHPRYFLTEPGMGYRFQPKDQPRAPDQSRPPDRS